MRLPVKYWKRTVGFAIAGGLVGLGASVAYMTLGST